MGTVASTLSVFSVFGNPGLVHSDLAAMKNLASTQRGKVATVSAVGGAAVLGTGGGAAGLVTGGAIGAVAGIVPAVFTLGASIPVFTAIGSSCGLMIGSVVGSTVGLVGGGAVGYGVSGKRIPAVDALEDDVCNSGPAFGA